MKFFQLTANAHNRHKSKQYIFFRELAVTQFSRTRGFRKLVPSFDEPTHKAVFQITIGRQTAYHTLSNMNRIEPARPM